MKISLCFFIALSCFSCQDAKQEKAAADSSLSYVTLPAHSAKTEIGKTGYTIALPPAFRMIERQGPDFTVFYITPNDSTNTKTGAGIYFGPAPDEHGPDSLVSIKESTGTVLGKTSHTVDYKTKKYEWIETVVDEAPSRKIQFWYFAYDSSDMAELGKMMASLERK